MCVKQIVIEYLRKIGADGLCNPEIECGCAIDDIITCGYIDADCVPAQVQQCLGCPDKAICESDCKEFGECLKAMK